MTPNLLLKIEANITSELKMAMNYWDTWTLYGLTKLEHSHLFIVIKWTTAQIQHFVCEVLEH